MARKRQAAQKPAELESPQAAEPQTAPPVQEAPPAAAEAHVNPFPKSLRTAHFDDYAIRLTQDQAANEMRIQFGSGQRADKPSEAVLDLIRRELVPEEFKTVQERSEGKDVQWFKFRSDPETGEGQWRMWMRNRPNIARQKAEQVFDAVVSQVRAELGEGPSR